MTTVIKIGDKVKWRNVHGTMIRGCEVIKLYDIDGEAAAILDCGRLGAAIALVTDLEPERKPGKTTILSGG